MKPSSLAFQLQGLRDWKTDCPLNVLPFVLGLPNSFWVFLIPSGLRDFTAQESGQDAQGGTKTRP